MRFSGAGSFLALKRRRFPFEKMFAYLFLSQVEFHMLVIGKKAWKPWEMSEELGWYVLGEKEEREKEKKTKTNGNKIEILTHSVTVSPSSCSE